MQRDASVVVGDAGSQDTATKATTMTRTTTEILQGASRYSQEAIATGSATTRQLQMQGEMMGEINRSLSTLEEELALSNRLLRNMSWTGRVSNWFRSRPKKKSKIVKDDVTDSSAAVFSDSTVLPSPSQSNQQQQQQQGGSRSCCLSKEDDKLLNMLAYDVSVLREQALLQQRLLVEHNQILDVANSKVNGASAHLECTNSKMKKR